jgi:hypothetical protein
MGVQLEREYDRDSGGPEMADLKELSEDKK